MRRYFIIPGLLLAFILFSAKRCDDDAEESRLLEEEELVATMDSVKTEFEADYLNEASLFAFQKKARQKLMDYADYMNVINDTSLDQAFREQAVTMIPELFYQRNIPEIRSYPNSMIQVDSIRVLEPLMRSSGDTYSGVLGFNLEVREFAADDTLVKGPERKMMEMIAMKVKTPFGSDTLMIWKVFLGEIIIPYQKISKTKYNKR